MAPPKRPPPPQRSTTKHLPHAGRDLGFFSTTEVRPTDYPATITSRLIAFPKDHYSAPPNVAGGFKLLHLSYKAPGLRANLIGSEITSSTFQIAIETWDKGVLYEASAQWIEHKSGSKECAFGQFDTRDVSNPADDDGRQEWSKRVKFSKAFKGQEPPEVVCWLNRIDIDNSGDANFRINAYATSVKADSAVFNLDTWDDGVLNGAALCWIAFPRGKKSVDCGTFATGDVRPWHDPRSKNSRRIDFKKGWFQRPPTVLVALNMFDMAGNADLRVRVDAVDIDEGGFTWRLDTWDDSTLYAAGGSWIALGFE